MLDAGAGGPVGRTGVRYVFFHTRWPGGRRCTPLQKSVAHPRCSVTIDTRVALTYSGPCRAEPRMHPFDDRTGEETPASRRLKAEAGLGRAPRYHGDEG
jgi:hypothetical protein